MLALIMTLSLMSNAQAQQSGDAAAKPAAKKGTNTSIFEKEAEAPKDEKTKSFSAKVKVVREESDGVEVFFDGEKNSGTFYLYRSVEHYATQLKNLEDSKKPMGAMVKVTVDADKRIKSVEKIKNDPNTDPNNKKWDLNAVPD